VLKAELAKARADAAAAVALAAERRSTSFAWVFLCISYADCYESEEGRNLDINVFLVGADAPVVTRRPGASLANPNKAARRVTAVEFASDSDDA
jgi:hypothetical protein